VVCFEGLAVKDKGVDEDDVTGVVEYSLVNGSGGIGGIEGMGAANASSKA